MNIRNCLNCGSTSTYIGKSRKGTPYNVWHKYRDGFLCVKCYDKLINHPKSHPKDNPRRMRFKDRRITLKENPRTGICSWCGKIGGKTDIHHKQYHTEDPLKDTIELCASCHMTETWRLGGIYI